MRILEWVEKEWKETRLGKALIFVAACFAVHWCFHTPPSNYSLIAMAVVAGLMALRTEMSGWERSLWAVVLIVFALVEIRAINHDNAVRDTAQRLALQEERQHFGDIAGGLTEAIRENQQNFNSVMANTDTLLKENLGGDSFCFMTLEPGALAWKNQGVPMFTHKGKYPLYGVGAQVIDETKMSELMAGLKKGQGLILAATLPAETDIQVGDLPAHTSNIMWNRSIALRDHEDVTWHIRFAARNGGWEEDLRASYENGQWIQSVAVYRMLKGNQNRQLLKFTTSRLPDAKPD